MIKKFLIILTIFLISVNAHAFFDIDKKRGNKISERFSVSNKVSINIGDEGIYEIFGSDGWFINQIQWKGGFAFKTDDQQNLIAAIHVNEITGFRKWTGYLMPWIESNIFKPANNRNGCVQRPYYHTFKFKKKGLFYNCFIIKHIDIDEELYGEGKDSSDALIRKAISDGTIKISPILLASEHIYFSFSDKDQLIAVTYYFDPKKFDNYKVINTTLEDSEFHRKNISKYPNAQKTMKKWISRATELHKDLEYQMGAKKDKVLFEYIKPKKSSSKKVINKDNTVVDKLSKLNQLYQSGALTKEEFEKAKKKLLN